LDDRQSEDISLYRYLPQTNLVNFYYKSANCGVKSILPATLPFRSVRGSGFMRMWAIEFERPRSLRRKVSLRKRLRGAKLLRKYRSKKIAPAPSTPFNDIETA